MLFGHLAWLGYVWLASTVVYAVVIVCVARWGSVDESLWPSVVAGWQRYLIFGAGVTIATTFLRMLVRNGVTRRTVSQAATIAMGVIAVHRGAVDHGRLRDRAADLRRQRLAAGAAQRRRVRLERPAARRSSTPRSSSPPTTPSGWIVGVCFYRWGVVGGSCACSRRSCRRR